MGMLLFRRLNYCEFPEDIEAEKHKSKCFCSVGKTILIQELIQSGKCCLVDNKMI